MKKGDDMKYLAALNACERLDSLTIQELLSIFSSAEAIWSASENELKNRGVPDRVREGILWWKGECVPEKLWERVEKLKLKTIDFRSDEYPVLLREIPDKPLILYVIGELGVDDFCIGVVGSRAVTPYGQRMTERISQGLVDAGVVIVSGLALGIDGISHKVAVGNRTKTVAVLAHGLNRIYPASHENLARKIVEYGGAIVSEYPPGSEPLKHHFLERNRIIAGLSVGTLVVEAAEKSGALRTAGCALEYSRNVYAVPGDAERKQSQGTNGLIKQGAMPVTEAGDILKDLGVEKPLKAQKNLGLGEQEQLIFNLIERQPKHVDEISRLTGMAVGELSVILFDFEMKDMVKNVGGGKYVKN